MIMVYCVPNPMVPGPLGVPGTIVQGSVPTSGGLPPTGAPNTGWLADDTGHLWVWDENLGQWVDTGPAIPPYGAASTQANEVIIQHGPDPTATGLELWVDLDG